MKFNFKKTLGYGFVTIALVLTGLFAYMAYFLPNVDAAPYVEIDKTPERVQRGKYLANNVAVCMDCHSSRDWSRFSAPLAAGTLGKGGEYFGPEMGFPGKFYSRNLTPTNLGDWTDGEIFRAITTGVDRHGKALFPVMPYRNYAKLDKEDVYDIIAYLRSLPPIENEIPNSKADFPMSLLINTIPKNPQSSQRPNSFNKIAYGEYLVNAASCIECHTQVKNGELISELAFSGGREFSMPNGILRSANITPDKKTGIGNWDENFFVKRFKAYSHSDKLPKVGKDEFNTLMPWSMYAGMETKDLEAMYAFLRTLDPIESQIVLFSERKAVTGEFVK
ncbi:c-type cytochrome [Autumnicola psychrophila]|uniref:Cytochrome c n=1 Tax=Autumnicola psychrophila TaxID=3075592 RepID=A0ABU3DQH5_9FLAO|nr:cytochrome c [Zunongwangia sp. F225]MDT0685950.1 cytochrome c [Zunongwangia sp. F225]